jgi:hypothetical protein
MSVKNEYEREEERLVLSYELEEEGLALSYEREGGHEIPRVKITEVR